MNYNDIWGMNAFKSVQMTNAILRLPRPVDDLAKHLSFNETPIYTKQFAFDVTTQGLMSLVPISAGGGDGDVLQDNESSEAQAYDIPTFVRFAYLKNEEVDSARLPGADTLRLLEDERNKKLMKLQTTFLNTKGVMRWSSLFGKVMGVNKAQEPVVIFDTAKKFGLKTEKLLIVIGDSTKSINDQLVAHKIKVIRKLGFTPARWKWFLCEDQHRILRELPEFKQKLTPGQDVRLVQTDATEIPVFFAGNVEVVLYNNPFIGDDKAILVPVFDDMIRSHNGKSSSSDFPTPLPMYVQKAMDKWNTGIEFRGEMKHIVFPTRVDCNTETTFVQD